MGGKNGKVQKLAQSIVARNPDWIYSSSIKIDEKDVEQKNDHGTTSSAIWKIPVQSVRVKLLPSQSYFFVGLIDQNVINSVQITTQGIKNYEGVYGLGLNENEVVMNGKPTRYKRPALNNGDIISFKYEKDRIFFKIRDEWDLLYVVGEGKRYCLCTEMCHLYSRLNIIEYVTMEQYEQQQAAQPAQ